MGQFSCVLSSLIFLTADFLILNPTVLSPGCSETDLPLLKECLKDKFSILSSQERSFCEKWNAWKEISNETACLAVFLVLALCISALFISSSSFQMSILLSEAQQSWLKFISVIYFAPALTLCASRAIRVNSLVLLITIGLPWILLALFMLAYGYCISVSRAFGFKRYSESARISQRGNSLASQTSVDCLLVD